ncbi:MAG TPA: hypothetical protein VEW48_15195 [Thermoanaerobaculia bacterium]|nr:hypothetical protein [Thermoanaerobaculia bacterium]
MATVQELSVLHRRYADLSHRFRAGWTFHQFLHSLAKSLLQRAEDSHSAAFQELYAELKEISQILNAAESDRIRGRLDTIDRRLTELMAALDEEDTKVTPDLMRQFFRRIKTYDDKILTQLVKFYIYIQRGGPWPPDRLDKTDFLLARLSEHEDDRTGEMTLSDAPRLSEIYQGLWAMLGAETPEREVTEMYRRQIDGIRAEVARMDSLDRLNESGLVRAFRDLKHDLGGLYFHPDLLIAIQDTNLAFKSRIEKIYRQEERRIVAEYQRVFELEREVSIDRELDVELADFRQEIERFEHKLQSQEFKLEDIAQIRQRVRELLPRLTAGHSSEVRVQEVPPSTGEHFLHAAAEAAEAPLSAHEELIGEAYRRLLEALGEINPEVAPERVVLSPEIFPLRLEPREVTAYRRLFGRKAHDRELEQFVLEAAALRLRVNDEAHEITGILDETSITGESPVYVRARLTARLADSYLWRFSHVMSQAALGADLSEVRQLEVLRMRLMRDYAGLWLLVWKPFFNRRPGATMA